MKSARMYQCKFGEEDDKVVDWVILKEEEEIMTCPMELEYLPRLRRTAVRPRPSPVA